MNKKLFIGGCGLAAIAGNVFAADEEYSYFTPCVALKGGYALLGKRNDIKYKGGFAGAVEFGFSYDAWRLGLELGYKNNKIKNFKLPGGFEGTNYILNGGFDVTAVGDTLELRDCQGAPEAAVSAVAIGEKSVFSLDGNGAGHVSVFDVAPHDDGFVALGLKNVTEVKFEKMSAMTGMVNVFYDYAMTDAWSLYAGVGLGVARVNLTVSKRHSGVMTGAKAIVAAADENAAGVAYTVDEAKAAVLAALPTFFDGNDNAKWQKAEYSKMAFAWQFMAGIGYELSENLKLTLGYKFFNTGKVDFMGKKIKTPRNHTAEAGFVLSF